MLLACDDASRNEARFTRISIIFNATERFAIKVDIKKGRSLSGKERPLFSSEPDCVIRRTNQKSVVVVHVVLARDNV